MRPQQGRWREAGAERVIVIEMGRAPNPPLLYMASREVMWRSLKRHIDSPLQLLGQHLCDQRLIMLTQPFGMEAIWDLKGEGFLR